MSAELHERLVARQTTEELRRKQRKAYQQDQWTQEDLDLAYREADELGKELGWCGPKEDGSER